MARRRRWVFVPLLAALSVLGGLVLATPGVTDDGDAPIFRLTVTNLASESLPVFVPPEFVADVQCFDLGDISTAYSTRFGDAHNGGFVADQGNDTLVLSLFAYAPADTERVEVIVTVLDGPAEARIFRREIFHRIGKDGITESITDWAGSSTLSVPGLDKAAKVNVKFCYKGGTPTPVAPVTIREGSIVDIGALEGVPSGEIATGLIFFIPSAIDRIVNNAELFGVPINDGNPVTNPISGIIDGLDRFTLPVATWTSHPILINPAVELLDVTDTGDNSNTVTLGVTSPHHLNKPILNFGAVPIPVDEHFGPYVTTYLRLNGVPDAFTQPGTLSLTGGGGANARQPLDHLVVNPLWYWSDGTPGFDILVCNPLEQSIILDNVVDIPLLFDDELAALFTGEVAGTVPGGRCLQMTVAESVIGFYNGRVPDDFQVPANATAADIADIVNRTGARPPNIR